MSQITEEALRKLAIGDVFFVRSLHSETEITRFPGGFLVVTSVKYQDVMGKEARAVSSTFVTFRDMFS